MKILHINTAITGGAATAALRIHQGMVNQGLDSHFLSLSHATLLIPNHHVYSGPVKKTKPDYPILSLKNWIKERFLKSYEKALEMYKREYVRKQIMSTPSVKNGFNTF